MVCCIFSRKSLAVLHSVDFAPPCTLRPCPEAKVTIRLVNQTLSASRVAPPRPLRPCPVAKVTSSLVHQSLSASGLLHGCSLATFASHFTPLPLHPLILLFLCERHPEAKATSTFIHQTLSASWVLLRALCVPLYSPSFVPFAPWRALRPILLHFLCIPLYSPSFAPSP